MSPYEFMTREEAVDECRRLHSALFDVDMRKLQQHKFERAEDGSSMRFETMFRKNYVWWLVHNLIAHTRIGAFPFKPFFTFHDWTSRKMRQVTQ